MGNPSYLSWAECLGRNGWDHPLAVPDDMGVEAFNVLLRTNQLAQKRPAASTVTLTGDAYGAISKLFKFVPAQDPTAAELFIVGVSAGIGKILRVPVAAAINLTLKDVFTGSTRDTRAVALNGKLFLAYKSGLNRLHVYSPTESTTDVRRAGLALPAAPTVANTGSGTYAATPRWYRVVYRTYIGGLGGQIDRQSNYGPPVAFTPSGSGTAARVTKPAAINEGETHWAIAASADSIDGPYYEIGTFVIATTFFDDATAPSAYSDQFLIPLDGTNYPFPSVQFLATDGTRLLGLGVYETSPGDSVQPVPGRLYWTSVLDAITTGFANNPVIVGDDEVIQSTTRQKNWLDLNVNGGGIDRGLIGPIQGVFFAFQSIGVFMIVPTGQATQPFRREVVSMAHGALTSESIVLGIDENGAPCVYFLDPKIGPCRVGLGGEIQWLGKDVKDIWDTVNVSATRAAASLYWPEKGVIMNWVAVGADTPTTALAYHVTLGQLDRDGAVRKGWSRWGVSLETLYGYTEAAVMFPIALTSPRPIAEAPYLGASAHASLLRQDGATNLDGGLGFTAFVASRALDFGVGSRRKRITDAYLYAKAQAATTVGVQISGDFGAWTRTFSGISIAAAGSETRVRPRVQEMDVSDAFAVIIGVGDTTPAAAVTWTLDRFDYIAELQDGAK